MSKPRVLLMLIILAGCAVYISQLDKREAARKLGSEQPFLKREDIRDVKVVFQGGGFHLACRPRSTSDESESCLWQIASLASHPAGMLEVEKILDTVRQMRVQNEFISEGEDLSQYGLDKPSLVLSFSGKGWQEMLIIGAKHGVTGRRYARRVGEDRILVVEDYVYSVLRRMSMDLWSKRPLNITAAGVMELRIERDDGFSLDLVRKEAEGKAWEAQSEGATFSADPGVVERVLKFFEGLEAGAVAGNIEEEEMMKRTAAASPRVIVSLKFSKGQREPAAAHRISFSNPSSLGLGEDKHGESELQLGPQSYFQVDSSPFVYELSRRFPSDFLQDYSHFRNRRPFEQLDRNQVQRIIFKFRHPAEEFVIERQAESGVPAYWSISRGGNYVEHGPVRVKARSVEEWLSLFVGLDVLSYIELGPAEMETDGLFRPEFEVEVFLKNVEDSFRLLVADSLASSKKPGNADLDEERTEMPPKYGALAGKDRKLVPVILAFPVVQDIIRDRGYFLSSTH